MQYGRIMNTDITNKIFKFREAARNLWNVHLMESANWDSVDAFENICTELYREIVLRDITDTDQIIKIDSCASPLSSYRVSSNGGCKLPIMANREIPASGYWDFPREWVASEIDFEIIPICFFDFDQLGWRDFEYIRVLINKCSTLPNLVGREALIECRYAKIEIVKKA